MDMYRSCIFSFIFTHYDICTQHTCIILIVVFPIVYTSLYISTHVWEKKIYSTLTFITPVSCMFVSLFTTTQKVNDPCAQHIYIQDQCTTFDIDKDK